jgi:hypothetical protein
MNVNGRCVLHDIFTEITILDKHKNDCRVTHLFDFGVDESHFWIIMKLYRCSLKVPAHLHLPIPRTQLIEDLVLSWYWLKLFY